MIDIFASLGIYTQSAIVCISLLGVLLHVHWTRKSTALGPTLLTTFGIFFCFAGIAWGLLAFNPGDIKGSVPQLLRGIRTSFWASVFGIGWALTIKLRVLLLGGPSLVQGGKLTGATIDDLATQLSLLNQSLAGADESSLLSQVMLLRMEARERLDRLNHTYERFAEKTAEANTKALIQSLAQVIKDFNGELNDQFGENFLDLNAAVGKLLVWQQQYEQQLNALIEQETLTRKSMTESALRFAELVNKSSVFTTTAESLRDLLVANNAHSQHLYSTLWSLGEMATTVAPSTPMAPPRTPTERGLRASAPEGS